MNDRTSELWRRVDGHISGDFSDLGVGHKKIAGYAVGGTIYGDRPTAMKFREDREPIFVIYVEREE